MNRNECACAGSLSRQSSTHTVGPWPHTATSGKVCGKISTFGAPKINLKITEHAGESASHSEGIRARIVQSQLGQHGTGVFLLGSGTCPLRACDLERCSPKALDHGWSPTAPSWAQKLLTNLRSLSVELSWKSSSEGSSWVWVLQAQLSPSQHPTWNRGGGFLLSALLGTQWGAPLSTKASLNQ